MYMSVYMYTCAWCPQKPENHVGSPKIEVINGCELLCLYSELNLRPLQVQQMLLTNEPSLQPTPFFLINEFLKIIP